MTKWLDHVRATRSQHPDKTYKQILALAKQSYNRSSHPVETVDGGAIIQRGWNDQAKRILNGYGNWHITAIRVQRAPVQEFVTGLLNTVTLGGYKAAMKSAGFDKMFHLGHVLSLRRDDGATKRVILEKNEVVNLSDRIPTEKDMEYIDVPIPTPFKTLNDYVDTTLRRIGSGAFFLYDAKNRNCQRFIMDNLRSNDVLTDPVATFVEQDADSIFKRLPGLQQFARTLTDLGAAVAHAKDQVVDTAQDIAKGTQQAVKATARQTKKIGRRIKKVFGGSLSPSHRLHSMKVPKSFGLAEARRLMQEYGIPTPSPPRLLRGYYCFIQDGAADMSPESFLTYKLEENPAILVVMGH